MEALQAIQQLLAKQATEQAQAQLEALAAESPAYRKHPGWLDLYGQCAFFQGRYSEAARHFQQALNHLPGHASLQNNLAESLKRAGEENRALQIWQALVREQPDYAVARYNLAALQVRRQDGQAALQTLGQPTPDEPAQWRAVRGDAWRLLGRPGKAEACYRQALEQDPDCFQALTNLGPLLLHKGEYAQAQAFCRKACALQPENGLAWFNLGRCHRALDDFESALEAFAEAYERQPDFMPLVRAITQCWIEMGEWQEARAWLEELKTLEGAEQEVAVLEVHILRETEQLQTALEQAESFLQAHPDHPAMLGELAQTLEADGQLAEAIACWRGRIEREPASIHLWQSLGHVLEVAGELEAAEQAFRQALEINPQSPQALAGLASLLRKKLPDALAERMEKHLQNDRLGKRPRASLHNGLAFWHDGQGRYEQAYQHGKEANRLYWEWRAERGWEYDPDDYSQQVDELIAQFDAGWFQRLEQAETGLPDPRPVFIVGMPRSGTTLSEQMLAAHPQVAGVGEAPFASRAFWQFARQRPETLDVAEAMLQAPDRLRGAAQWHLRQLEGLVEKQGEGQALRIVDKMPDNYSLLPWLLALFPRAKIIHLRRDPRDVAVSCWMTQFGVIRWAFDETHLARRIEDYLRLTAHWRAVAGHRWLELDYEALVNEPETQLQRVFRFMELDFHPDCLAFHQNRNAVRTASITQVRQPLYKSATERWRRYQPWLGGLFRQIR